MENKLVFVDRRFNPEKEPEKWKMWQESENRRRLIMNLQRGYVRIQNYFWPTKLMFLPAIFVGILLLERIFWPSQGTELLWDSFGLSCLKSSALTLFLVHLRHGILYLLFQYRSWIVEIKPSKMTKLWFACVSLVSSKITNWLAGNWLLPSLPAPQPLQTSVDRFVESMEPCLSSSQAVELKTMANNFMKTMGPNLHNKLMWKASLSRNWLAQWWVDYAYLATKASVHRTTMVGIGPSNCFMADWKEMSGLMLYQVFYYFVHKYAVRDIIPSCVNGKIPMEMKNLDNVIGACRIPTKDRLDSFINVDAWKESYIVIHAFGRYFQLYMYDTNGKILSPSTLRNLIEEIYEMCIREPNSKDPCIYTYMERYQWADILQELRSDSHNDYVFRLVTEATFVIHILDGIDTFEDTVKSIGDFGGLTAWCDKTMNLIGTTGGFFYVCCEHSHCDAVILGALFSDIFIGSRFKYATPDGKIDASKFHETSDYPQYSELHWNLSEKLEQNYETTKAEILKNPTLKIRLSIKTIILRKDLIKKNKMGPDSFCQCAIYWAYYRKHKKIVNSYQPASLMFFTRGRTENNRPLSVPKMNFVKGMEDEKLSREEKIDLLRIAANYHHEQNRIATAARGYDRHLFGLYIISKGLGIESDFLEYFISEGQNYPLCTTSVPMSFLPEVKDLVQNDENAQYCSIGGQFRPWDENQYAVAYSSICKNVINMSICDLEGSTETNAFEFADLIIESINDLIDLLSNQSTAEERMKRS